MRLAGQHAVITGGGTGIGAAIARVLADEGAAVTLVGRRREQLDKTAASLIRSPRAKSRGAVERSRDNLGPNGLGFARRGVSTSLDTNGVFVVAADVTDRVQVDAAFSEARQANGPITILIANAGAAESAPFAKLSAESWRRMMAVNLDAVFHCAQAALPDLKGADAGRLIAVASVAGLKGSAYTAAYTAAKHGAVGLMRALAAELVGTNVTANAVCPGYTETALVGGAVEAIVAKTGRAEAEVRAGLARFNPGGRLVEPDEVANTVLWLCLPGSGSINGQAIVVAGGEA